MYGFSTSGSLKSREIPKHYYTLIKSLAPATQAEYTRLLEAFFHALQLDDAYPSIPHIVQFILDRWEAGKSPSTSYKFISALNKWYTSNMVQFHIGKGHPATGFANAHKVDWEKTQRVKRIPLQVKEVDIICKTSPTGVPLKQWRAYVSIAWVFLLRHSEIQGLTPCQLSSYTDTKGADIWQVFILGAKTSKSKKDKQYVRFPEEDIPIKYIVYLNWFVRQGEDFVWNVGTFKNHIDHIRTTLKVPAENDAEFVFHCTRHGRATWLSQMASYSLEQVQSAGRWKSKSSAYIYMH